HLDRALWGRRAGSLVRQRRAALLLLYGHAGRPGAVAPTAGDPAAAGPGVSHCARSGPVRLGSAFSLALPARVSRPDHRAPLEPRGGVGARARGTAERSAGLLRTPTDGQAAA